MAQFDFDKIINRRNTNCVKWDECAEGVIPMWVADMDFQVAPAITEALRQRVEHGVFGYTLVPDSYYEATINWFSRRHAWQIKKEWIQYIPGVVPALSVLVKALTEPGDGVIIQTPVYNCFFSSIRNNGCEILLSPLKRVPLSDGLFTYEMDFDDLERQAAKAKAKVMILCNPHNPAGRVWTPEELERVNDICQRHGVRVVADEIHCELVMGGYKFTPYASVSEACLANSITCNSPSKSFNIAGLQISNIICPDPETRERIDRAININEVCDVNPFGVIALQAAYNEGEPWLKELCCYLEENYKALRSFFAEELPNIPITRLEGTYLPWADISRLGVDSDTLAARLLEEGKVMVNAGTMYDTTPAGRNYIRLNIACPRTVMMEGLNRIKTICQQY